MKQVNKFNCSHVSVDIFYTGMHKKDVWGNVVKVIAETNSIQNKNKHKNKKFHTKINKKYKNRSEFLSFGPFDLRELFPSKEHCCEKVFNQQSFLAVMLSICAAWSLSREIQMHWRKTFSKSADFKKEIF